MCQGCLHLVKLCHIYGVGLKRGKPYGRGRASGLWEKGAVDFQHGTRLV
jgi:hypothetical protein